MNVKLINQQITAIYQVMMKGDSGSLMLVMHRLAVEHGVPLNQMLRKLPKGAMRDHLVKLSKVWTPEVLREEFDFGGRFEPQMSDLLSAEAFEWYQATIERALASDDPESALAADDGLTAEDWKIFDKNVADHNKFMTHLSALGQKQKLPPANSVPRTAPRAKGTRGAASRSSKKSGDSGSDGSDPDPDPERRSGSGDLNLGGEP